RRRRGAARRRAPGRARRLRVARTPARNRLPSRAGRARRPQRSETSQTPFALVRRALGARDGAERGLDREPARGCVELSCHRRTSFVAGCRFQGSPRRWTKASEIARLAGMDKRRKHLRTRLFLGVALVATALSLIAYAFHFGFFEGLERQSIDMRFSIRGSQSPPKDVVLVNIDDETFNDLARVWPFNRTLHAKVIDRVCAGHPKAI